jgi:hypothetical protein
MVELTVINESKLPNLAVWEDNGSELVSGQQATIEEKQHFVALVGMRRPVYGKEIGDLYAKT